MAELLNEAPDMKLSKLTLAVLVTIIALAAGCNGNITQPMQSEGTRSANFPDGTEFLAQSGVTFSLSGSNYVVTATDDDAQGVNFNDEIALTVPQEATLPYTVSTPIDPGEVDYWDNETHVQYYSNQTVGQCTITITQTSPTLIGTFQAVTVSSTPPDTVVLRSGSFNANPQ